MATRAAGGGGDQSLQARPFRTMRFSLFCSSSRFSTALRWHCKRYIGRGVMKFYVSGAAPAEDVGVPVSKMQDSIEVHHQASLKTAEDPNGGPYPSIPERRVMGRSLRQDEPREEVPPQRHFGSRFRGTTLLCCNGHSSHPLRKLMKIQTCWALTQEAIRGLYAAGEVAGGAHGNNSPHKRKSSRDLGVVHDS